MTYVPASLIEKISIFSFFSKISRGIWKLSFYMNFYTYVECKTHIRSLLTFSSIQYPSLNRVVSNAYLVDFCKRRAMALYPCTVYTIWFSEPTYAEDGHICMLGDEILFCMISAWAEKLGKTHTWLWKWYSASEATIRRPEMHMLIKLTIFLPWLLCSLARVCVVGMKCRSYYVCKIVKFFPKLTTHNTVWIYSNK